MSHLVKTLKVFRAAGPAVAVAQWVWRSAGQYLQVALASWLR